MVTEDGAVPPRNWPVRGLASNERFPIVRLIGVAGALLWVYLIGGMMSQAAPASAATMAPIHCSIENTCTFDGVNGTFEVTTAGSLAWMSHAGGWLECAGGPTGSVRATVRVPGYGPITYGFSGKDSAPSFLAVGDGYLAVDAQFRGAHGTDLAPEVAIFPIDPRCEVNLMSAGLALRGVLLGLLVILATCSTSASSASNPTTSDLSSVVVRPSKS